MKKYHRPSVCGSNVNQSPRMMRNRCEPGPHIPEEHHHLHADEVRKLI